MFALDGWNAQWNDELFYNRVVRQMREVGMPSGMAGYNEVPAPNPSYGTYSMVIYIPYYLGSFITGCASHNFMYMINMGLGVIACLAVILVLRPGFRESMLCVLATLFGFIVSRFFCSGMTEASYVLFAAVFASCALYVLKHADSDQKPVLVVVAFAVMIASVGFWGAMRPYILAFMLVVWALLIWAECGLRTSRRIVLFAASVLVALVSLAVYLYLSKYYMSPYFEETTLGNGLFETLASGWSDVLDKHLRCASFVRKNLMTFGRVGVMLLMLMISGIVLVVMSVSALRKGDKRRAAFFFALVLVGIVVFEAHMLMYTYAQMHRTMIPIAVVYMLVIIWHGSSLLRSARPYVPIAVIGIASIACAASLAHHPQEFVLPQVKANYSQAAEMELRERLTELMPRSDDRWDNTVAHPTENAHLHVYYTLPEYLSTNVLEDEYLEQAVRNNSLKSKYVCLPTDSQLKSLVDQHYKAIYRGQRHVIYQVRE